MEYVGVKQWNALKILSTHSSRIIRIKTFCERKNSLFIWRTSQIQCQRGSLTSAAFQIGHSRALSPRYLGYVKYSNCAKYGSSHSVFPVPDEIQLNFATLPPSINTIAWAQISRPPLRRRTVCAASQYVSVANLSQAISYSSFIPQRH